MTGFEPQTSGIRSDHSTNWATTTALLFFCSKLQSFAMLHPFHFFNIKTFSIARDQTRGCSNWGNCFALSAIRPPLNIKSFVQIYQGPKILKTFIDYKAQGTI